jgi:large repetitive protein
MFRALQLLSTLRPFIPIAVGALALALHGGANAPAATQTLYAAVGPGYTITLTDSAGVPVTQLSAGTYTIVVNDQATNHNFHLIGSGVDMTTTVAFVGQVTWTVNLVPGAYHFVCDPHADGMFGDFTVVGAADTTPPDTTITAGPTGSVNTTTASFSFSATEAGSSYQCALDTAAFAACATPKSFTALAAGQHNFQVRAIDAAGNVDATPAARAWTVDTTPPDTTLTAGPTGTVGATSASFSFTSPDATATFQCSLDSTTAYTACTSPKSYTGLAGGAHAFRVRAVDPAGNLDASPASRAWTIDATPPDTTISVAPSGTVASADASFEFASSKAGGSFECALDGAPFAACSSPTDYLGLADGTHTFLARAIDTAGNVDATPAAATWTIDTTGPETTIDSGPAALVNSGTATFSFSASEAGSSFECSLDGAGFAACSSPQSYSGLADGAHTLDVRATDAAGNLDASPANSGWTVDSAAPDTTISSGPAGTVGSKTASFSFSASEAGSTFQCALDGAAFAACSSPQSYTGLAEGAHSFQVRSIDLAGNADASAASSNFTIDTTALYGTVGPGFTITLADAAGTPVTQLNPGSYRIVVHDLSTAHNFHLSGPGVDMSTTVPFSGEVVWTVTLSSGSYKFQCDPHVGMDGTFTVGSADTTPPDTTIGSGPTGSVASSAASFAFGSTEAGSSYECALDGAAFGACSSPVSYTGLADGAHSFQVRATDAAGNADSSPASRSWTIDTTPPDTTITAGPSGTVTSSSASFDFSAGEAGASFACSLDGAPHSACASPQTYSGLVAGTHTFQVRAADALGNADATPASRSWTIQAADTTAPETTIGSGPAALVNVSSASFGFSASEAGSTFECAVDGAAFAACSSPQGYSGLADGSHSFQVRATDAAGNTDATPAARSWRVDTAAPDTSITAGPTGTVTATSASFSFSATEAGSSYQCALDSAAFAACSSPKSYSVATGSHTFRVRALDAAGNSDATPATRTWTVQAPAPPPPPPPPPPTSNTLYAQVGPGDTASLKDAAGNSVRWLAPGTYTIVVRDLSTQNDFYIDGPGVEKETGESWTGQVTWTVTFVNGEYEYGSDEAHIEREFDVGTGHDDDEHDD